MLLPGDGVVKSIGFGAVLGDTAEGRSRRPRANAKSATRSSCDGSTCVCNLSPMEAAKLLLSSRNLVLYSTEQRHPLRVNDAISVTLRVWIEHP